jgi:uncharacterized membrane protein YdcZ (DUF606 family)
MNLINIGLPILNTVFSTSLIYGTQLYKSTNNIAYLFFTVISAVLLVYVIYQMYVYKFRTIDITIYGKVVPTIVLSLLGFFVIKDSIITMKKIIGLVLIIIGIFMLE